MLKFCFLERNIELKKMDFETQTQKKKYRAGVFGDIYSVMMLPKELEIEKDVSVSVPSPLELRSQLPDFKAAFQVSCLLFLFFF